MINAAGELFVERGYAGTTLVSVAGRAGVSLATVKLVAPTKAALLLEVAYARARGDASSVPLADRPPWSEMLAEPDPRKLIARWVEFASSAHERQAGILDVVRQAAAFDSEVAEVERRGAESRRTDFQTVVAELAGRDALRPELDVEAAVDIAWSLNSPELFRLFAARGWAPERWRAWLAPTLTCQLLR